MEKKKIPFFTDDYKEHFTCTIKQNQKQSGCVAGGARPQRALLETGALRVRVTHASSKQDKLRKGALREPKVALPSKGSALSFEQHTHKQHLTILHIESCISYLDVSKAKSMMPILLHPFDQTQARIDVCQNEALKTH